MQKLPNTNKAITKLNLSGIDLIANERSRQIRDENYNYSHDDKHTHSEIALAAVAYAAPMEVIVALDKDTPRDEWSDPWQWASCQNKKAQHCRLKQLVIAGALIAAEIDRIQRSIQREEL